MESDATGAPAGASGMYLHHRYEQFTLADIEIREAAACAVAQYGLTYAELVAILAGVISSWTKSEIREERSS